MPAFGSPRSTRISRDLARDSAVQAIGSYDKERAAVSLRYVDGKIAQVLPVRELAARMAAG